jgi:phosphoribosylanthranilate isomerase
MRTGIMWIKLCGVQSIDRVEELVELDVDALGINRYEPSSRYVSREQARELVRSVRSLDDEIELVGVYVNPDENLMKEDHSLLRWDIIQLHGDESPDQVRRYSQLTRTIKAFSVDEDFSSDRIAPYDSWAFMLDAYHPTKYGGTGKTIPWETVKELFRMNRVVLSGGLTPENVRDAIRTTDPFGVDVCSGIENDEGLRDLSLAREFVQTARETATRQPES